MLLPDKDWATKKAKELGPSNFTRRRIASLGLKEEVGFDPIFTEIEADHDLEIETHALRIYAIDYQKRTGMGAEEALKYWVEVSEEERDYFRVAVEQVIILSKTKEKADQIFDRLANSLN
jgi:hypothetical protein